MKGNSTLNYAKYSRSNTDEWYTTYETIAEEITHYKSLFYQKIVLCNCDNPFKSQFSYYFLKNFNSLGLKKLICTSYAGENNSFITNNRNNNKGYLLVVSEIPSNIERELDDNNALINFLNQKGMVRQLKGNGDFRSDECVKYLKECDICCTNPPFSLFSDLFSLLVKYNKKYLIVGNQNAITYKEIFPYIKENKAWVGYRFGDMAFKVPSDTQPRKTRFWIDELGQKWRSLGNAMWLTNLDIPKRYKKLKLTQKYNANKYPKFDNFDAINVAKVVDIPLDFNGIMGVPITYLKYHNNEQFEIIGEANHGSDNEFDLFKPILDGRELFKKILIKRKE